MNLADVRICDILKNEYTDFLEYCTMAGKETAGDLTPTDYIAYRTQFGVPRAVVMAIRSMIENFDPTALNASSEISEPTEVLCTPIESGENPVNHENNKPVEISALHIKTTDEQDVTEEENCVSSATSFALAFAVDPSAYTEIQIEELRLGTRSYNALRRLGCKTVADLLAYSVDGLVEAKNIGKGSVEEIQQKLLEYLSGETQEKEKNRALFSVDIDNDMGARLNDVFNANQQVPLDGLGISELTLSVRAKNALNAVQCTTLNTLLSFTVKDLWELPHIGRTTVENIVTALSNYFSFLDKDAQKNNITKQSQMIFSRNLRAQVERMLAGTKYDRDSLSSPESEWFDECSAAKEILGAELCIDAINAVPAVQGIMLALSSFQIEYSIVKEIDRIIHTLPSDVAEHQVRFYWFAYCRSVWYRNTDEYISVQIVGKELYDFLCNQELPLKLFANSLLSTVHDCSKLQICVDFVKWIASDLKATTNDAITYCLEQKSSRCIDVLYHRAMGKTLEEIGTQMDITRERVRQMEKKAIRLFVATFSRCKCEVVLTSSALSAGTTILRKEHLEKHLDGKNAEILWYVLCKGELDGAYYQFDENLKAVVIGKSVPQINLEDAIAQLPERMFWDEANAHIAKLSGGNAHLADLLRNEIVRKYKQHGQYLHRSRLTVVEICEYILKNRFPNGYKIADEDYEKQFRTHMNELFGDVKGLPSGHSIDAKMAEVGFLCDRGKYVHPTAITIDPAVVDFINAYIADSPRTVLTFGEIFDALKDSFAGTNITNKYIMQGALNRYGCPFITKRDYVTKESSTNVAEELTLFIKTNGKMHKSVIEEEFAFDDIRLGQVLSRCPEIISLSAGYFIHSNMLVVTPNEMQKIREYLRNVCSEAPVSTRAMLNDFNLRFTDFILNNGIEYHGNLFGILQYLFKNEFHFSRPFISMEDIGSMTSRSVLLTHMNGIDSIEMDDLNDMCDAIGIRFLTVPSMLAAIQPEYIRIDESTIMRSDLVGITDEVICQVEEAIRNDLELYRYRPTNKIDDFSWYPDIMVEWTPFLVESIMMLTNGQITSTRIPMGVSSLPSVIFFGEEFADEDYASFVMRILSEEHRRDPFSSASQVLSWLIENGLCYKKLPSFLEDGEHMYTDENGVFVIC